MPPIIYNIQEKICRKGKLKTIDGQISLRYGQIHSYPQRSVQEGRYGTAAVYGSGREGRGNGNKKGTRAALPQL